MGVDAGGGGLIVDGIDVVLNMDNVFMVYLEHYRDYVSLEVVRFTGVGATEVVELARFTRSDEAVAALSALWKQLGVKNIYTGRDYVFEVTHRARASSVSTITTASAHGFSIGDQVNVYNVGDGYNGSLHVLTAVTATTFSYESPFQPDEDETECDGVAERFTGMRGPDTPARNVLD